MSTLLRHFASETKRKEARQQQHRKQQKQQTHRRRKQFFKNREGDRGKRNCGGRDALDSEGEIKLNANMKAEALCERETARVHHKGRNKGSGERVKRGRQESRNSKKRNTVERDQGKREKQGV